MRILECLMLACITIIIITILIFQKKHFIKNQYAQFLEKKLEKLYSPLYYYANKTIFNLNKEDFENLNEIIKKNLYLASNELRGFLLYFIKSNPSFEERTKKGKLGAVFSQVIKEFKEISEDYIILNKGVKKKRKEKNFPKKIKNIFLKISFIFGFLSPLVFIS